MGPEVAGTVSPGVRSPEGRRPFRFIVKREMETWETGKETNGAGISVLKGRSCEGKLKWGFY